MAYELKSASQIVSTLERTAQRIKDDVNVQFRLLGLGVSYEQWVILSRIFESQGCTQIELAADTKKNPASVCRTLQFLSRHKLILKEKDESNKKANRIYLTEKGVDLVKDAKDSVENVSNRCLENIFERERNIFVKILERIQEESSAY